MNETREGYYDQYLGWVETDTTEKTKTWDKEPPEMVKKVGEALKEQCLKEFGSTWDNDTTWNFAVAAIEAMRSHIISLGIPGLDESLKQSYKDVAEFLANKDKEG